MRKERAGIAKRLTTLSDTKAINVLAALRGLSKDGQARTSISDLAKKLTLSEFFVGTALTKLENLGFVNIRKESLIARATIRLSGIYPYYSSTRFTAELDL